MKATKPKSIKEAISHNEKQTSKLGVKDSELPVVDQGSVRHKAKYDKLGFWQKRKLKKNPDNTFLIYMMFSNGTCREFVIKSTSELFQYKKRWYYLRYENSWFNLTQNQYVLCFFDDYPVPIDRKVLKEGDKNFWTVTPENLKPLFDMQYVKVLSQSQELDKKLTTITILVILVTFIQLFVIYFLFKLGKGG